MCAPPPVSSPLLPTQERRRCHPSLPPRYCRETCRRVNQPAPPQVLADTGKDRSRNTIEIQPSYNQLHHSHHLVPRRPPNERSEERRVGKDCKPRRCPEP